MKNDKFNFYDNKKIRAACLVSPSTDVTSIVNSTQAPSRHIEGSTQCCFVPNLTRFVDSYCVRPRYQRHLQRAALQKATRNKTITSAIADCRKRVPLPPRLARKLYDLIIFGILDLRCIFDYTKQLSQGQQLFLFGFQINFFRSPISSSSFYDHIFVTFFFDDLVIFILF